MSIVINCPKTASDLEPLIGLPVVVGNIIYGVLVVNYQTDEVSVLTPDQTELFRLPISKINCVEEITQENAFPKWGLKESFERVSKWYNQVDWSFVDKNAGWVTHYNDLIGEGELSRNGYTKDNAFKFL